MTRKLRVFLCHASEDKPAVQELYDRLISEVWIEPWLDKENLLPGQDWNLEINKATREADVIIICMSKVSVEKEGYLNKEIRRVLDISNEKLEGAIYIIPLRLDDCNPSFERLKQIHYADYFTPNAHERLLKSLRLRADALKIGITESKIESVLEPKSSFSDDVDLDLYRFIQIPASEEVPYSFCIGKYPVTNAQYERFLNASDFGDKSLWINFPKYNVDGILIGKWGTEGWDWLQEKIHEYGSVKPYCWDSEIGIVNPDNPVICVSWYEASAYCNWVMRHWNELSESRANPDFRIKQIRLSLESEWVVAAGGDQPTSRFPWDTPGKSSTDEREIIKRANIENSNIDGTTPVNAYIRGASPYGVMDMVGNVWEWQSNFLFENGTSGPFVAMIWRGGSWHYGSWTAKGLYSVSAYDTHSPDRWGNDTGFRLVCLSR